MFRIVLKIIELRNSLRAYGKSRMGCHIRYTLPSVPDLAAIT